MSARTYLRPYLDAVGKHGAKFESLLWANPSSQAARFAALARWCELDGRTVLDAGCGRADFLTYLHQRKIMPAKYIGIEAVAELAEAAVQKKLPDVQIILGDFIDDPQILNRNADVILFSGSLNTLSTDDFYQTLRLAWQYTHSELGFNFLSSLRLASAQHLTWHRKPDVLELAYSLTADVAVDSTYRDGDCTVVMRK
jgi:SAM-dependent methyltransferase